MDARQGAQIEKRARCDRCPKPSAILLPYGPHNFCEGHFKRFFEKRVYRTIRRFGLVKPREKIAVGVSGGKDSLATLKILAERFGKSNEVCGICIDEGIRGYRGKALAKARKEFAELGVEFEIVEFEELYGSSLDKMMKTIRANGLGSGCAFCGVFRRDILNAEALRLKAKKIATGHNLDDECQSIVMNVFMNDARTWSGLGPIVRSNNPRLVPRVKPLYESPEREVIAYAALSGIDSYDGECCPYSALGKRAFFREMINQAEERFPGTKFAILRNYLSMRPLLEKSVGEGKREFGRCACGNPTSGGDKCNACMQLERLAMRARPRKIEVGKLGLTCAETKGLKKRVLL